MSCSSLRVNLWHLSFLENDVGVIFIITESSLKLKWLRFTADNSKSLSMVIYPPL